MYQPRLGGWGGGFEYVTALTAETNPQHSSKWEESQKAFLLLSSLLFGLNVLTCRRGLTHTLPGAAAGGQTRHISTRQAFKHDDFRNFLGLVIQIDILEEKKIGQSFVKKQSSVSVKFTEQFHISF